MTTNEKLLGKHLVVEWTKTGGTMITLNTYSRNFTVKQAPKDIDVTVRDDVLAGTEDLLAGIPARDVTLSGLDSDELTPKWEAVDIGDVGVLQWYRQGKATGKQIATMTAVCTGSDFGSPYDGANDWTVNFKGKSAIVLTTGV